MAENDTRPRVLGTTAAPGDVDREVHFGNTGAPGTWDGAAGNMTHTKANPIARTRLPEHGATAGTFAVTQAWGRDAYYAQANQKDVLPEHQARRDKYPHIGVTAS